MQPSARVSSLNDAIGSSGELIDCLIDRPDDWLVDRLIP